MKKKFTEGEWIIDDIDILSESGMAICQVYDASDSHILDMDMDVVNSNAKLIAAAPDMFAALEYLIEAINPIDACRGKFESLGNDRAYVGGMTLPTDESILRCIEAIKKATE